MGRERNTYTTEGLRSNVVNWKASAQRRSRTDLERGESLDSSLLESREEVELASSSTTAPK
jgi:hypothetical protein